MAEEMNGGITQLRENLRDLKVKDLMTTSVISVPRTMSLSDLAHLMIEKKISGLPVCDADGKMEGIVTATDLFVVMDMIRAGKVVEGNKIAVGNPTVEFAMSSDVITISPETSLDEVIDIMVNRNAHTFPVIDNGRMVGIIGRRDVYKLFYSVISNIFNEGNNAQ